MHLSLYAWWSTCHKRRRVLGQAKQCQMSLIFYKGRLTATSFLSDLLRLAGGGGVRWPFHSLGRFVYKSGILVFKKKKMFWWVSSPIDLQPQRIAFGGVAPSPRSTCFCH